MCTQVLCSQIIRQEALISENRRPALRQLIGRLIEKMSETQHHSFSLFKASYMFSNNWACSNLAMRPTLLHLHSASLPNAYVPPYAVHVQVLRAHILPLTNCAFNKAGDRFITGSYDRTCKVTNCPSLDPSCGAHREPFHG
jgi:dynein assembly factor with WDR repeat domains 1